MGWSPDEGPRGGRHRAPDPAHKVMGAGVATSPHFPWVGHQTGEGQASFPGRIGFRQGLAASSVPSRVAGAASLPGRSPSGCPVKASSGGIPARFRPGLLAPVGSGSDHHQGKPRRFSFRGPLPEGLGSLDGFGKWVRHWLSPLPRASSSARPASRFRLASILVGCLPLSAVAAAGSFRPFPVGGSWPRLKLARPADSPKLNLPVDK